MSDAPRPPDPPPPPPPPPPPDQSGGQDLMNKPTVSNASDGAPAPRPDEAAAKAAVPAADQRSDQPADTPPETEVAPTPADAVPTPPADLASTPTVVNGSDTPGVATSAPGAAGVEATDPAVAVPGPDAGEARHPLSDAGASVPMDPMDAPAVVNGSDTTPAPKEVPVSNPETPALPVEGDQPAPVVAEVVDRSSAAMAAWDAGMDRVNAESIVALRSEQVVLREQGNEAGVEAIDTFIAKVPVSDEIRNDPGGYLDRQNAADPTPPAPTELPALQLDGEQDVAGQLQTVERWGAAAMIAALPELASTVVENLTHGAVSGTGDLIRESAMQLIEMYRDEGSLAGVARAGIEAGVETLRLAQDKLGALGDRAADLMVGVAKAYWDAAGQLAKDQSTGWAPHDADGSRITEYASEKDLPAELRAELGTGITGMEFPITLVERPATVEDRFEKYTHHEWSDAGSDAARVPFAGVLRDAPDQATLPDGTPDPSDDRVPYTFFRYPTEDVLLDAVADVHSADQRKTSQSGTYQPLTHDQRQDLVKTVAAAGDVIQTSALITDWNAGRPMIEMRNSVATISFDPGTPLRYVESRVAPKEDKATGQVGDLRLPGGAKQVCFVGPPPPGAHVTVRPVGAMVDLQPQGRSAYSYPDRP